MFTITGFVLITTLVAPSDASDWEKLREALASPKEKVRARAASLLSASAEPRAGLLLETTALSDESVLVRLAAVEALASRGSARALPTLFRVGALDEEARVRAAAETRAVARLDEKSLPFIRRAFEEPDPRVRSLVIRSLPKPLPLSFQGLLIRALGDYPDVRKAAFTRAMALVDGRGWLLFEQAAKAPETAIGRGLAEELGAVDDPRVVPLLLALFDRGEPELRKAALASLARHRKYLSPKTLLAELESPKSDSHARMRALKLLETVGGPEIVAAVIRVLSDSDLPVRATAAMVLARLGEGSVVPRLETMVSDPVNERIVGHLERALEILREGLDAADERR